VSFEVTPVPPSYLTLTDGTIGEIGVDDLPVLYFSASIKLNGKTVYRDTIKKVVLGGSEFASVTALTTVFSPC
jgi:hypothetical protein